METALTSLLEASPGHRVALDLLQQLEPWLDAPAELWLADYRQTRLIALRSGKELAVDDSWVGRCFAAQTTVVDGDRTAVPVTTRGNRMGALTVDATGVDTVSLIRVCALLAQAISSIGPATSVYETTRRPQPMTVAAELQWALLPGQSYADDDITMAALLEPAYSIAGDCYDWSRDHGLVHVAVLDGTGRGVPAALAATLAVGALRNARYTGASLADQAALADQAVYAHHGGEVFTSALLLQLDTNTGEARIVDAGSPLLMRWRDGRAQHIELDPQLPLGMFEETLYDEQVVDLRPGDRLLAVSNGVHGTAGDAGPAGLERILSESRLLSPAEVCRHVLRQVRGGWGDEGPADDAVVLCLDWHPGLSRT
ncbi:MAG: PP2C family protein-serine/threonine phosphatase [Mycobacteriales bacterium]